MNNKFFIHVDECNILVQQSRNKKNPAIIFIHGASISSAFWYKQFADKHLAEQFSLYAFDLPGHGQSGKAKDSKDYSLKGMGNMLYKIIESLTVEEYIIVSLSIAGNMVAEAIENLKGCKGIFMAGACLLGQKFPVSSLIQPFPYMHLLSADDASEKELEDYAQYDMFHPSEEEVQLFIENYRKTDPAFRTMIGKVLAESDYTDEVENMKTARLPLSLVYGKEEAIVQPGYLKSAGFDLWGNKIHLIENAGHLVNLDNAEDFNSLLFSFAKDVFDNH